jgi:uncharacterized membrane protein
MVFLLGGPMAISETITTDTLILENLAQASGSQNMIRLVDDITGIEQEIIHATSIGSSASSGIIADLYHNVAKAGNMELALMDGINNAFFDGRLAAGFLLATAFILMVLFTVFVRGILNVGVCRFYLETRLYNATAVSRILFVYKLKRTLKVGGIIMLKYLYLALWTLTIVGLPVRYYSYYLVSHIAAENPDIGYHEVFDLSREMMRGHKWRVFLFDLSFLPWRLLSLPTLGLLGYLYVDPYVAASRAELYMTLRMAAFEKKIPHCEQMNDRWLAEFPEADTSAGGDELPLASGDESFHEGRYPVHLFTIPEQQGRRWISADFRTHYTAVNLALLFFIFSFIGWVWECGLEIVMHGAFANRGTLYGPWLPIYGTGGVCILLILRRFFERPVLTFFLTVLTCGIVEYFAAWGLETFMHLKYWDYSGYFFNIQGRVCLEGLLVFGVAGTASVYFISPLLNNALNKLPGITRRILCGLLVAAFCADMAWSVHHPHTGRGITE